MVSRTIEVTTEAIIVTNADRAPDWALVECLLGKLDTNAVLVAQLQATRAIDGMQTYEDDQAGLRYVWNYTPQAGVLASEEDGLTLTIEPLVRSPE